MHKSRIIKLKLSTAYSTASNIDDTSSTDPSSSSDEDQHAYQQVKSTPPANSNKKMKVMDMNKAVVNDVWNIISQLDSNIEKATESSEIPSKEEIEHLLEQEREKSEQIKLDLEKRRKEEEETRYKLECEQMKVRREELRARFARGGVGQTVFLRKAQMDMMEYEREYTCPLRNRRKRMFEFYSNKYTEDKDPFELVPEFKQKK